MKEKYSIYEFEIMKVVYAELDGRKNTGYIYEIYSEGCLPYDDGVIESDEYFDTEEQSRFAAIGHITLLENGEG